MSEALESAYLDEKRLSELGIGTVGTNVRISEHATIVGLSNCHLGSNIRIDSYVVILARRGRLSVGSNVHIEPNSSIVAHHGVSLGNFCTISHGVRVFTASADYTGKFLTNVFPDPKFEHGTKGPVNIGDHVIIGGNCVVMPGVHIGEGAAVGALSFVRHSLEPWSIWAGNPIRRLGSRNTDIKSLGEMILGGSSVPVWPEG